MIQKSDRVQYGVIRSTLFNEADEAVFETYTKISYFFQWISHETGMKLPKCHQQAIF